MAPSQRRLPVRRRWSGMWGERLAARRLTEVIARRTTTAHCGVMGRRGGQTRHAADRRRWVGSGVPVRDDVHRGCCADQSVDAVAPVGVVGGAFRRRGVCRGAGCAVALPLCPLCLCPLRGVHRVVREGDGGGGAERGRDTQRDGPHGERRVRIVCRCCCCCYGDDGCRGVCAVSRRRRCGGSGTAADLAARTANRNGRVRADDERHTNSAVVVSASGEWTETGMRRGGDCDAV